MTNVVEFIEAQRAKERSSDNYQDVVLTSWKPYQYRGKRWAEICWNSGTCTGTIWPEDIPDGKPGDRLRIYGGLGQINRGISRLGPDGTEFPIWYQTEQERKDAHKRWVRRWHYRLKRDFKKNEARLNAEFKLLPLPLKRRIERFRAEDKNFRWREEAYEMASCAEGGRLYRHALDDSFGAKLREAGVKIPSPEAQEKSEWAWEESDGVSAWEDTPENRLTAINAINSKINGYNYKLLEELLPDMDRGHSGNTWGHAVMFARILLRDGDEAKL